MKKYISAILINALLIQFAGCFSMQKVTKDEFLQASDYPELNVKTEDKEYTFEEGNYIFTNDTIYGKGELKLLVNPYVPFEGTISINDVEKIEMDKITSDTTDLVVKTREKEFIFKNDESTYSIKNDTIYGKGKYKFRNVDDQFEVAININDTKEIQIDKFNLGTTIVLASVLVLTIAGVIVMRDKVGQSVSPWR